MREKNHSLNALFQQPAREEKWLVVRTFRQHMCSSGVPPRMKIAWRGSKSLIVSGSFHSGRFIRWDEGRSPTGCDTPPMIDVLKAQRKGDRQCRRLALCRRVERIFLKGSSPLAWIWEIAPVRIAS